MLKLLNALDMFGVSYTFKTRGNEKFTTAVGGVLSITTFCVITTISLLFGTDFYLRQNPKFLENNKTHEKQQVLFLEEVTHPFMIKIGKPVGFDGMSFEFPEGQNPLKTIIRYEDIKSVKGKFEKICDVPKAGIRCSETILKNDTRFENDDLSQWYCLDHTKIKRVCREKTKDPTYQPKLSGVFGDTRMTQLFIAISNHDYDDDGFAVNVSPSEPLTKIFEFAVDIRYPKYYFNSELVDNSLLTNVENQRYFISPTALRWENNFLKQVTLNDDLGWILESISSSNSVDLDKTDVMYYVNDLSKDEIKGFYGTYFLLNANEKVFKRVFMRIQDVGAQIGGFAKVFISSVTIVYFTFVRYKRDQLLIQSTFDLDSAYVQKQISNKSVSNNTIVNCHVSNSKMIVPEKTVQMIGFFEYYMRCCRNTSEGTKNTDFFNQARAYINKRLDLTSILILQENVERLAKLTLSEEDLQLLNCQQIVKPIFN